MKKATSNWGRAILPTIFFVAIAILLVLPFMRTTAANPTLTNADFETGPFDMCCPTGTVTGWTVTGRVADTAEGATNGSQHGAALSAGGDSTGDTLSQNFSTTSGTAYTVDFDAGIFGKRTGAALQIQVDVIGSGSLFSTIITPPDANTFTPASVTFQHYQFPFTANTGTTTLRFTSVGLGNANADQVVDTVVIAQAASAGTTICDVQGAAADACYVLRPPPCTSGQAFWFPNADCFIPEGTDCVNPQSDPSTGTDGFKYIFTAGPFNTSPVAGTFTENPNNGTATLTGHLESLLHPGYGFNVNITFTGLTTNPNLPGGNGPNKELSPSCYTPTGPVNPATWHFYSGVQNATLTGTGLYDGAIVQLIQVMHFFQVGNGASGKNIANGMSGWFDWVVSHQPSNPNFCIRPSSAVRRTADFNLSCEPRRQDCTGQIGDFVWQDNNSNGCQDAGEPGIPNVKVELFNGCPAVGNPIDTKMTDQNGKYLFTNLCHGSYTVRFTSPTGFTHTVANAACSPGGDTTDSDCACTGTTSPCDVCVTLPTDNSSDLTIDCGYIPPCTGQIGDFVWQDNNGNGCQDVNEPGIPNVKVDLFTGCGVNKVFKATTMTDNTGHYLFSGLCAGDYTVSFTTPAGFTHTTPNASCALNGTPSDERDSDCDCTGTTSPCDVCVNLPTSSSINLTIDCGYISPCSLTVTKSCATAPSPSPTAFDCSKMKPINVLKQTWNGNQTISIKAWKGSPNSSMLLLSQSGITNGTTVTVTGYAGSGNDVIWEIFTDGFGSKIGQSTFHLSCSDVDMNGPEDCGKAEGDGKGKTGFINTWIFAGMSGNGVTIDCGSNGSSGGTNCVLTPGPNPDCKTAGKPTSLMFQYTGGGCGASNNPQSGKFVCNGSVNTALPINVSTSTSGYTISPTTVSPGGFFTVSTAPGKTFSAQSNFALSNGGGTENLSIHTSCSQILAVGNVFGDITLVGFNGQTGGNTVTYHYTVKNNGNSTLTDVMLTDNVLGSVAGPFTLNSGETKAFDVMAQISQTTTNTATATAQNGACSATSGPVTVSLPSPTPTPSATPQTANCTTSGKPNRLVMTYTGGSCASSQNSQGPPKFSVCQKFCCTEFSGGLTGASPAHVIVSSSSSTPTGSTQRFFEADVALNSPFTVLSGSSTFGANTYFFIYENGVLKQKVQLHTSCSAPLIRTQTFGGVRLDDYSN